jgi:hypothetical protein
LTQLVRFYGLVHLELAEAIEIYKTAAGAEEALAAVLRDEPEWDGLLTVELIDLGQFSLN